MALNGDGGDESFAGYRRYVSNDMARALQLAAEAGAARSRPHARGTTVGEGTRTNSAGAQAQRLARLLAMDPHARYAHWMSAFPTHMRRRSAPGRVLARHRSGAHVRRHRRCRGAASGNERVDRMLDTDVNTYLPADLLVKMDIATMAYSVEGRSPFLDHHLMEFAAALPAKLKLRGIGGKVILKSALRGIVPDDDPRPAEDGLRGSAGTWFRDELRRPAQRRSCWALTLAFMHTSGPRPSRQMIDEHHNQRADHSMRLWTLLQLELWHREVVEAPLLRSTSAQLTGNAGGLR